MNNRVTPHVITGFSPAKLLMGRRLQTSLPMLPQQLDMKKTPRSLVSNNDQTIKDSYKRAYDKDWGGRPLPKLKEEDQVRIKTDAEKHIINIIITRPSLSESQHNQLT